MKKIFAIHDRKIEAYHTPTYQANEIEAVRGLTAFMSEQQSNLTRFSDDFTLYILGEFDEVTGKHILYEHPKFLISCNTIIRNILETRILQDKLKEMAQKEADKKDIAAPSA